MKEEIKQRWLAALRSGEYCQGEGKLKQLNTSLTGELFCCLGVLCDLYVIVHREAYWVEPGCGSTFELALCDTGATAKDTLPLAVTAWSHVTGTEEKELITLNDVKGKSFTEIADWIEVHL